MRTALCSALAALALCLAAPARSGPVFPLEILSPSVLPAGAHRFRLGVRYDEGQRLAFQETDRHRRVWSFPEVDLVLGIAPDIEAVVSYPFLYLKEQGQGWNFGSGDLRVSGIYRLVREGRRFPETALRVGVKLPNADEVKAFGTNETDFIAGALAAKRAGAWTCLLNGELAILGNPRAGTPSQDDVLLYRAGAVYAISRDWSAGLELDGVEFSRYGNDRRFVRGGVSVARKGWAFDAAVAAGLTPASGDYQLRAGVSLPFGARGNESGGRMPNPRSHFP